MKTASFNHTNVDRSWIVVDLAGQTLGRVAARIAAILRGKTKPTYTPFADVGDFVVVVNSDKLVLTGDAIDAQEAYRINLVNEVVDDDKVMDHARALAARVTRHPLMAIRTEMEVFVRCEDLDSDNAYALTDHMFRLQRVVSTTENWEVDFKKKGVKGG